MFSCVGIAGEESAWLLERAQEEVEYAWEVEVTAIGMNPFVGVYGWYTLTNPT